MAGKVRYKYRKTLTGRAKLDAWRSSVGSAWLGGVSQEYPLEELCGDYSHGRDAVSRLSAVGEDVGGAFRSVKTGYDVVTLRSAFDTTLNKGGYYGPPVAGTGYAWQSPTYPATTTPAGYTGMDQLGTKAIAETIPTAPAVSLPNVLGEILVDGIPRLGLHVLQTSLKKIIKGGAEDYLNFEFGWKPFVKDIIDTVETLTRAQDILDQYARDSGRPVRRRFVGTTDAQTWNYTGSGGIRPLESAAQASVSIQESSTTSWWFSGTFMYYLPQGDDYMAKSAYRRSQAQRLLGLGYGSYTAVEPLQYASMLYELAPWTWLIDWVTDLGDVIKNVAYLGADGLVLKHGYVMRTTETVRHLGARVTSPGRTTLPVGTHFYSRYRSVRKNRVKATPYGFGLTTAFSDKQWSILVALGLARGIKEGTSSAPR
jgi:hypothetical protein